MNRSSRAACAASSVAGRLRRAGRAAAGAGRVAELALADLHGDVGRLQAEDFGGDDRGHRPLGGAEVLRRGLGGHGAVAADDDVALVGRVAAGRDPPQVCSAMPMPCLTVPALPLPGGCHFSFQSDSLTAMSSCSL